MNCSGLVQVININAQKGKYYIFVYRSTINKIKSKKEYSCKKGVFIILLFFHTCTFYYTCNVYTTVGYHVQTCSSFSINRSDTIIVYLICVWHTTGVHLYTPVLRSKWSNCHRHFQ